MLNNNIPKGWFVLKIDASNSLYDLYKCNYSKP